MHTPWTLDELNLARQGRLLFSPAEVRAIQQQLGARQSMGRTQRKITGLEMSSTKP